MSASRLQKALSSLPQNAPEAIIKQNFVPVLLEALGFNQNESFPEYPTGKGNDKVDFAARKNVEGDIFLETQKNPFLLIEIKGREVSFVVDTKYNSTVNQLKRYLSSESTHCQTVQWGIITNGDGIQLFKKHGKVVFAATHLIQLTLDNIDEKVLRIKKIIDNPSRALFVVVYNNKGGVGKTTTTVNLAATLNYPPYHKKVLVIDFDPNQKDLTHLLSVKSASEKLYNCLEDYKNKSILQAISGYRQQVKPGKSYGFDVIAADENFLSVKEQELTAKISRGRLRQVLQTLRNEYDYILIDSPPNWQFFSQEAVMAADVVLMPTKHNNLASLQNAAVAISRFFPDVGNRRRDVLFSDAADPTPLPIFYNGEDMSDAQKRKAQEAIMHLIDQAKKQSSFNLVPYFFPKYTQSTKNMDIFMVKNHAYISGAAFQHKPAVHVSKEVWESYKMLVKEYFIG